MLLFFLTAVLVFTAQISLAQPLCENLFSKLDHQFVDTLIREESLSRWVYSEYDYANTNLQVKKLLSSTEEERQNLLSYAQRLPELKENTRLKQDTRVLKLLLRDPKTWLEYVDYVSLYGDQGGWILTSLYSTLQKLPDDLKGQILEKVISSYFKATKNEEDLPDNDAVFLPRNLIFKLGPKRAFDGILRAFFPAEIMIKNLIGQGHTPVEAYSIYFENVSNLFSTSGVGKYNAFQVLASLKALQNELHAVGLQNTSLQNELVVYGSFVTGKAQLYGSSDIDILVYPRIGDLKTMQITAKDIESYIVSDRSSVLLAKNGKDFKKLHEILFRSLSKQISAILGPSVYLPVNLNSGMDVSNVFISSVNPILFIVGLDKIQMVLYDPISTASESTEDPLMNSNSYQMYDIIF